MEWNGMQCNAMQCNAMHCTAMQCNAMHHCMVSKITHRLNFGHTHETDLKCFAKKVLELFKWHEFNDEHAKYFAPYMPLIQSSGMGKTKLLYELKQTRICQ